MFAQPESATEYVGYPQKIIFRSETDDFLIIACTDGKKVAGEASVDDIDFGTQYRFFGKWETSKHGERFTFETFQAEQPSSQQSVINYLSKRIPGVGLAKARKLWNAYGSNVIATLRDTPAMAVSDGLLTEDEAAAAAAITAQRGVDSAELFALLGGKGFGAKAMRAIVAMLGDSAAARIRENPFVMLQLAIPRASFRRCDRLWLELGHDPSSPTRLVYALQNWLACRQTGDTWHPLESAITAIRGLAPACDPKQIIDLAATNNLIWTAEDPAGGEYLADSRAASAEQSLALSVVRLCTGDSANDWPTEIPASQTEGDGLPSAHQCEQLQRAFSGRVGLFLGGPGTGKTHTLAFALRAIVDRYGRDAVALCAPTGKAAVRMTEAIRACGLDMVAKTMHTLLGIRHAGKGGDDWGFAHGPKDPLPYRFIIVDESSMIPLTLMNSLLSACADGTHVLFVGDCNQLPPVGHGAPLRDLIAAGLPQGMLTEVRRNAGLIVRNCQAINRGEPIESADRFDPEEGMNLRLIHAADDDSAINQVVAIVTQMRKFDPVWDTQIIVASNKSSKLSRETLNKRLKPVLNPHGKSMAGCPWTVGDKVICLQNTWLPTANVYRFGSEPADEVRNWTVQRGRFTDRFIANGEIGKVLAIGPKQAIVRFSNSSDCVLVNLSASKEQPEGEESTASQEDTRDSFALAYAITCHKSQGSQAPCVIVLADAGAARIADRHWWYTAISRASKLCIIVGRAETVAKQCEKVTLADRKTFLEHGIRTRLTGAASPAAMKGERNAAA